MKRILANDGLHPAGIAKLEAAGFTIDTDKIAQDDLPEQLNNYDVVLVRSATKIRQPLIDACPNIKIIGRGGVGLDNIDVDHANAKGVEVYNTPAASSRSVAELAMGHALNLSRFLHQSNREMPVRGNTDFKGLKKSYSAGIELKGKTLGVIGFGRIGQQTAVMALGMGMKILPTDPFVDEATISLDLEHGASLSATVSTVAMEDMLAEADVITLHVPSSEKPVLGSAEMALMKDGVILINASRGGTIDEDALLAALESGKVGGAGLDVFIGEPEPRSELINHPRISVSPHIGAATGQAQANIGIELADKIIAFFEN